MLPAIYRVRDAEQGEPLRALLAVIAEQVGVLEENLEQLYDDQFIETCAEWVVPYIGDLIGYRSLHGVVPKVASPRAEVAHTIAFRRRKGTATMLEQLARDVTGWPARVVECFQVLGWTQHMNHVRPESRLRARICASGRSSERLDTPFDRSRAHGRRAAHRQGARQIQYSQHRRSFSGAWRLSSARIAGGAAAPGDTQRFLFDPLGRDMQLFTRPEREERDHPSGRADQRADADQPARAGAVSRALLRRAEKSWHSTASISRAINICDLSDAGGGAWAHTPPPGRSRHRSGARADLLRRSAGGSRRR